MIEFKQQNPDSVQQNEEENKFQIYRHPSQMPEGPKIGLSLSFCVDQIMDGSITADSIDKIYAATNAPDEETWQQLMDIYSKSYWSDNPKLGVQIATELKSQGKIIQPRTEGKHSHNIAAGYWIMSGDEQKWLKYQGLS